MDAPVNIDRHQHEDVAERAVSDRLTL